MATLNKNDLAAYLAALYGKPGQGAVPSNQGAGLPLFPPATGNPSSVFDIPGLVPPTTPGGSAPQGPAPGVRGIPTTTASVQAMKPGVSPTTSTLPRVGNGVSGPPQMPPNGGLNLPPPNAAPDDIYSPPPLSYGQMLQADRAALMPPDALTLPQRTYAPLSPYPTAPTPDALPTRDYGKEALNNLTGAGLGALIARIAGRGDQAGTLFNGIVSGARQAEDVQGNQRVNQWQVGEQQKRQVFGDQVNGYNVALQRDARQRQADAQSDATKIRAWQAQQSEFDKRAGALDKGIAAEEKNAAAQKPKPGEVLRARNSFITTLKGLDPASQQQVIHAAVQSGDWKTLFGEDEPAKNDDGSYQFTVKAAAPVKAPEDVQKIRATRVGKRIEDLNKQFYDDHTTDAARKGIIAELQTIKKAAPDLYPGRVPQLSDYRALTPSESASIAQRNTSLSYEAQRIGLEKQRIALQKSGKGPGSSEYKALWSQAKAQGDWLKRVYMSKDPTDAANALEAMKALDKSFPGSVGLIPSGGGWGPGGPPPTAPVTTYTLPGGKTVNIGGNGSAYKVTPPGKPGGNPAVPMSKPQNTRPRSTSKTKQGPILSIRGVNN